MSDEEIIESYRRAKYPNRQVYILSQLTLKSPQEIVEIIRAAGLKVKEPKNYKNKIIQRDKSWTEQEVEELYRLLSKNYSVQKTASIIGQSASAIYSKLEHLHKTDDRFYNLCSNGWTEEEVELLLRLKEQGLTYHEIAKSLPRRSCQAVKLKYLNVLKHKEVKNNA